MISIGKIANSKLKLVEDDIENNNEVKYIDSKFETNTFQQK